MTETVEVGRPRAVPGRENVSIAVRAVDGDAGVKG